MNVLMLSSSKYGEFAYLAYAKQWIDDMLNDVDDALFIPYAGVTIGWDAYTQMVQNALPNKNIQGIHEFNNPVDAVNNAHAILVGGGNTFNLLHLLYEHQLIDPIKTRIEHDMPYIGWSAGSNICGKSIGTTNDMPIVEPKSFKALGVVNAQLNPHYTDYVAPNHHGETRDQRINEYCVLNPSTPVLAIREGSALRIKQNKLSLLGELDAAVFASQNKISVNTAQNLSEYL